MTASASAPYRTASRRISAVCIALGIVALAACDERDGRELPPARPDQTASVLTTTIAPATTARLVEPNSPELQTLPASGFTLRLPWVDDGQIPAEYTCTGTPTHDVAPRLVWEAVPAGTVELAVVLTDQTADGYVLWAMSGIDPALGALDAGVVPAGAVRAANSTGAIGYSGPCPPSGTHDYLMQLFAIDQQLELTDGTPASDAVAAIEAAAIDSVGVAGVVSA